MNGLDGGTRWYGAGGPSGIHPGATWRVFLFVPAKLAHFCFGLDVLLKDTSVAGFAIVDDVGTLVLVSPLQ